jgi:hypothetical protein
MYNYDFLTATKTATRTLTSSHAAAVEEAVDATGNDGDTTIYTASPTTSIATTHTKTITTLILSL